MRNLKKIIAVVVTLVMLLSVASFGASAANEPVLALYGKHQTSLTDGTEGLYELAVHLTDAGNVVGGIEGVITYDAAKVTYDSVEFNANFVAAGNPEDAVLVDNPEKGTIKFVGLNDTTSVGEWFVLKFKVIATGEAAFTLEAKGANTDGTAYVADLEAQNDKTMVIDNDLLNVEGVRIKRINDPAKQDLKFVVNVDETKAAELASPVVEYGIMMMFTKRLGYGDLTVDMIDNATGLAHASTTTEALADFEVNLNKVTEEMLGVKVAARAYAKLEDGTVIYSNNYNADKETVSGYASKSVVDVAREAALDCTGADVATVTAINDILAKDSIKGDDRVALLKYINDYYPAA